MSKVSKVICLISLLAAIASAPVLQAQNADDAADAAAKEGVRREYDTLVLRKKLGVARIERQQGNLVEAGKHYQECYLLAQKIGPHVDAEMQEIVGSYSEVLMQLAAMDQKQRKFTDAEEKFDHIIKMDPNNQAAVAARRENHKLVEAQAGRVPSKEALAKIPGFRSNDVNVATLVQDGKFYFEAGRLDDAEDKLNRALQKDPSSVAANYYMRLIKEKRMSDTSRRSEIASADALLQVEKSWDVEQRSGQLVPHPNPFNRTNLVYTSKGRQNIISKLDRILVDEVKFDNLPLPEVIRNLTALAKQRDPDKQGINFMIDRQTAGAGGVAATDPSTGLPIPVAEGGDITAVNVKIDPPLNNVRLADVLDAIVRTSEKPIKYSILDYAISFSTKNAEPVPLEIRTFRVDPNTFRQGLESVTAFNFGDNISTTQGSGGGSGGTSSGGSSSSSGQGGSGSSSTTLPKVNVAGGGVGGTGGGGGGNVGGGAGGQGGGGLRFVTSRTNSLDELNVLVRQFFIVSGVDFNTNQQTGKTFIFNDRKGVLTVRATAQDLDMIAAAIDTLNQSPPQVNIKAKFAEISQNDSKAIGFQWNLGNFNLGGGNLVGSGGTQPSLATANGGSFPGVVTPGNGTTIAAANTTIAPASSDGVLAGPALLRNPLNAPTLGTLTGIMTDPQFRVAMQALEQRDGVDLLTAPEVTTESGRQAEMQAVDLQTIVTQNSAQASGSGFGGTQSGVNSPIVNQPVTVNPGTQLLPFGPVLDVIPYVSSDEFSIQMTIIPTVTEFIGYDDPGQFIVQAQQSAGSAPITAQLPLPHFRVRQVVTSVCVWDSQTVVLGGLITDSVTKTKDKVPMLGDLPLVGRLFRSESSQKSKKNLMIFVTPTIINPDGTRYHSDEEMPFMQNGLPPQKAAVTQ